MPLSAKRLILLVLGGLGSLMVWPCLLVIQYFQASFPSYLLYSAVQGAALGIVFGAIFGSFEGIVVTSRTKAFKGAAFGAAFGTLAGAAGVLAGQAFLFLAGSLLFKTYSAKIGPGLAVATGIGWVLIGVFIAMTEGLRSRSARKTVAGLSGGVLGGLSGGAALQLFLVAWPGNRLSLLAGLLLFGLSLGFFLSLLENRFSSGTLKLLNGPLKGKEYIIVASSMTIGTGEGCDIVLKGYPQVEPLHATLQTDKGKVSIKARSKDSRLLVNDDPTTNAPLRREDVIAIGKAKFMFGIFA